MVEMLKQGVNAPIPFHKQVILIYAGINGMLDNLDVTKIKELERTIYNKLDTTYSKTAEAIIQEKKLTDAIEEDMKKIIKDSLSEVE